MVNAQRFPSFNGKGLRQYFDDPQEVSSFFGVPERTARDWWKHDKVPRNARRLLDVAQAGFMPMNKGWEQYRIYNGMLYTPKGHAITPDELSLICSAFDLPLLRNVQNMLNDRHKARVPDWAPNCDPYETQKPGDYFRRLAK